VSAAPVVVVVVSCQVEEEERQANEQNLITVVSDSISSIMLFALISQQSRGRQVRGEECSMVPHDPTVLPDLCSPVRLLKGCG
jgi:hypothetical protein